MKTLLAAITLASLSALSWAEATQFSIPSGQLSRAEVVAAIGTASPVSTHGDASVFELPSSASTLTRAQVLAAAAADRGMRHQHGESNALRFADAAGAGTQQRTEAMVAMRGSARFGDANRDDFNLRTR